MISIVEFFRPLIMIWVLFVGGLLFWVFLGLLTKYMIRGIIKILNKILGLRS